MLDGVKASREGSAAVSRSGPPGSKRRSSMAAFWLTFDDPQLELRWRRGQCARRRLSDEGFFLVFSLMLSGVAARAWRVKTGFFDKSLLPALGIEWLFMFAFARRRPKLYARHRDALVALQKTFHFLITCHLIMVEEHPDKSWKHFLGFEVARYGKSIFMAINGLLLPLGFREHMFVQSLQLAISNLYNPRMCDAFLARVPANAAKYRQMHIVFDTMLCPLVWAKAVKPAAGSTGITSLDACLHIHSFLQTFGGFVLPSLFLYAVERSSRSTFLQRHTRRQRLGLAKETGPRLALWLCLLYLGTVFLWRWLGWILSKR